jgi:cellulose synthase/poly-beta-1,6-N-acetylglucosamine synthase-like glycosyltransferase
MLLFFETFFWILIFIPLHSYLLYPLFIKIISCSKKQLHSAKKEFGISIIIAAYNEEKVIRDRIENLARIADQLQNIEVYIGSDNSDDNTNIILQEYERKFHWLKIFCFKERRGKAAILNDLVKLAKGEVLVFSDANTLFEEDAVNLLMHHFNDPIVGGVSGRLVLKEPEKEFNKSIEEKRYWEYETFIKKNEGKCGILIGANGGIFAVRKNVFSELPLKDAVTDDLYISLSVLQNGFKFNYENEAVAYEDVAKEIIHEYRRKIRFAATNFQTLKYCKSLLFNRNFLLSYAFWSHKITRWFLPHIYPLILILNLVLLKHGEAYRGLLLLQAVFLLLAGAGYLVSRLKLRVGLITLPYFFLLTNFALFTGFIKYIRGKHSIIWDSTPR